MPLNQFRPPNVVLRRFFPGVPNFFTVFFLAVPLFFMVFRCVSPTSSPVLDGFLRILHCFSLRSKDLERPDDLKLGARKSFTAFDLDRSGEVEQEEFENVLREARDTGSTAMFAAEQLAF